MPPAPPVMTTTSFVGMAPLCAGNTPHMNIVLLVHVQYRSLRMAAQALTPPRSTDRTAAPGGADYLGVVGTSIHIEACAGHVGVARRSTEGDRLGDLLGQTDSAEVDGRAKCLGHHPIRISRVVGVPPDALDHLANRTREDCPRGDGIDKYSLGSEGASQIFGEARQCRLGCRVGNETWGLVLRRQRGEIDDAGPRGSAQQGKSVSDAVNRTHDALVERISPHLVVAVVEAARSTGADGIDEDVDPAPCR